MLKWLLLHGVPSALMAGCQKGMLLGMGPPAPQPQKAVLYSVDQPPGPIVWPEDCGVQLLNAPLDGSVDDAARVRQPSCMLSWTRQYHKLDALRISEKLHDSSAGDAA